MKVLIVGGANGLGLALARMCLGRGDDVVIMDCDTPEELPSHDFIHTDVSDASASERFRDTLKDHAPFDLVAICAGISATGAFEAIDPETHGKIVSVNLIAPIEITRQLVQANGLSRGGRLVFVSSLSHFVGYPGAASYGATKDGIVSFARAIAPGLRKRGAWVYALAPGPMDTAHAARHAPPGAGRQGRMAPDAVARYILALRGRRVVRVPGMVPKAMAMLGRLFPGIATRIMRRQFYEKLVP